MNINQHNVKIIHETFGSILNETFVNAGQFKLFLKMINGCIDTKTDLTFFNGTDFFVHIPYKHLICSIIKTNIELYTMTDHIKNKSKIEALEIK
jgi:hypothetical protein